MNIIRVRCAARQHARRELVERAYFRNSYRAPLSRRELGIVDVFFGFSRITRCG